MVVDITDNTKGNNAEIHTCAFVPGVIVCLRATLILTSGIASQLYTVHFETSLS